MLPFGCPFGPSWGAPGRSRAPLGGLRVPLEGSLGAIFAAPRDLLGTSGQPLRRYVKHSKTKNKVFYVFFGPPGPLRGGQEAPRVALGAPKWHRKWLLELHWPESWRPGSATQRAAAAPQRTPAGPQLPSPPKTIVSGTVRSRSASYYYYQPFDRRRSTTTVSGTCPLARLASSGPEKTF